MTQKSSAGRFFWSKSLNWLWLLLLLRLKLTFIAWPLTSLHIPSLGEYYCTYLLSLSVTVYLFTTWFLCDCHITVSPRSRLLHNIVLAVIREHRLKQWVAFNPAWIYDIETQLISWRLLHWEGAHIPRLRRLKSWLGLSSALQQQASSCARIIIPLF